MEETLKKLPKRILICGGAAAGGRKARRKQGIFKGL